MVVDNSRLSRLPLLMLPLSDPQQGTLVMLLQQIIFVNFNRVLWVVVRILRLR
jgi:hypothetical protein